MAKGDYYYSTEYSYNVFGADEHLNVVLWKEGNKNYKRINTWSYSTFMMNSIANRRAESRIMRLRKTYEAKSLPE